MMVKFARSLLRNISPPERDEHGLNKFFKSVLKSAYTTFNIIHTEKILLIKSNVEHFCYIKNYIALNLHTGLPKKNEPLLAT